MHKSYDVIRHTIATPEIEKRPKSSGRRCFAHMQHVVMQDADKSREKQFKIQSPRVSEYSEPRAMQSYELPWVTTTRKPIPLSQ